MTFSDDDGETYRHGQTLLTRRSLLKAGAAAGTAAAIGSTSTEISPIGRSAALVDYETAIRYTTPVGIAYQLGETIGDFQEQISDVEEDQVEAHQDASSEAESYLMAKTTEENGLKDTISLAHMEARHSIASDWEDGKSAEDAYANVEPAIRDYYESRVDYNWWQITAKALAQISVAIRSAADAVVNSGDEERDSSNPWCGPLIEHPDYGDRSWSEFIEKEEEQEVTLIDGSTAEVPLPDFYIVWDSDDNSDGDYETTINLAEIIDDHLDDSSDFAFEVDGEEVTWNGNINIPNVPDADLPGRRVLALLDDFVGIRNEIEDQIETAVDSYNQTFVDNLYEKLDNDEISPNDIRGIDGQARFLSGTEDVAADAYYLSLAQQLNMDQVDLSKVASMTVEYSGATKRRIDRDDSGDATEYPDEFVDNEIYEGLLYSRNAPDAIDTDERYAVGPLVLSGSADNNVSVVSSGSNMFNFTEHSDNIEAVLAGKGGKYMFTGGVDNDLYKVSLEDGSVEWSESFSESVESLAHHNGSLLVGLSNGEIRELDPEDGSEIDSFTDDNGDAIRSIESDGDYIYYGAAYVVQLDSDYNEQWEYEDMGVGPNDLAVDSDGSLLVTCNGDDYVIGIDPSDGSELWKESYNDELTGATVSADGSMAYFVGDGRILAINADGTEEWEENPSPHLRKVELGPGGNLYVSDADGNIRAYDSDGNDVWTVEDVHDSNTYDISVSFGPAVRSDITVSGVFDTAYFYDAGGDSGEVPLVSGILTIDSMQDQDGDEVETTDSEDWGSPEYDSTDAGDFVDYLIESEEYQDSLQDYDQGELDLGGAGIIDVDGTDSELVRWILNNPVKAAAVGIGGLIGINLATD